MRWLSILAGLAVCAGAAGCAVTDQFSDRIATVHSSAATSRDTMVLNNIVRASHAEPLSFVQLGQIGGSTGTTGILGLPPLVLGPKPNGYPGLGDTIFGASAMSGTGFVGNQFQMTDSTNFQATPSETKEFYLGLLREVEPRTLALFIQQGIAREVLFDLFTDRMTEQRGGVTHELRNDPLDPNFDRFRKYVELAMNYGLSSEMVAAPKTKGGKDDKSGKSDIGAKSDTPEHWRLCFDKLYYNSTLPWAANSPVCGSGVPSSDDRAVSFNGRDGARVTLRILPRSAFGIFQYLGRIVAAGDKGRIPLTSAEAIDQGPFKDEWLFNVQTGVLTGDCFVNTWYEGQSYCVPREGAANTKRILGLLVQLIALNTSITDIPVAQTVRVVQ